MNLSCSMFLIVLFVVGVRGQGLVDSQLFLQEPQGLTEVLEGENIKLSCRVQNKTGVLQWTKDDFGLGTDRELAGFDRYRMTGDMPGQYDLEITNATLEDIGRYQCQVGATDTVAPIRSTYAEVSVVAAPEPPVITAGARLVLRDGRTSMVQCISKGGRPASTIRWLRSGVEVREGVETKVEELPGSRRMATVSTLTFKVNTTMQGATLVCEAANSVQPNPAVVSTTLEVQYEPSVQLKLEPEVVYEGDKVRLMCQVDAVPAQVEYRWEIGGVERSEGRGASELIIEAVSREMHSKTVACIARNSLGQASSQLVLNVKYSPVFLSAPMDVLGDVGERVRLGCSVSSNPLPTYTWTKDNMAEEVGRGEFLSLVLSNRTAGRYTCHATVRSFPPVSTAVTVQVRGPPAIVPGREVQHATIGQPLKVVCEAESVPEADGFSWTFRGAELRPGSSLYSILETRSGSNVLSTLVVDSASAKHFGEYVCTVKNQLGSTSTIISLNEIEAFPLLVVVAGGIGGLLLTVVVIVVLLACRRAVSAPPDISDWPRMQQDRLSTSTNTTSNQEDLDGSDSMPELYLKAQPDILNSNLLYGGGGVGNYGNKAFANDGYGTTKTYSNDGYGGGAKNYSNDNNYAHYPPSSTHHGRYASDNNLLDNKFASNYSSPYLQSVSPVSDVFRSHAHWAHDQGYVSNSSGDPPFSASSHASGRFNAVAHSLQSNEPDLNESSVGTHV